jgi:glycerol uptake facilitator-like aquaporin
MSVAAPSSEFTIRRLPFAISAFTAKLLVEGIGSFIFVLTIFLSDTGCGPASINGTTHTRNLSPIAIGFQLAVLVFTFGYISGGHFNPAVTCGVMLIHGIRIEEAIAYVIAQCSGGVLGAAFGVLIAGYGPKMPAPEVEGAGLPKFVIQAFIGEAIFTGCLVTVVLHVACAKKQANNGYYGLAIGMCVLSAAYAVGGISGGSFNPMIATSLQLVKCFSGYCMPLMNIWLYWAAPGAGALGASILFKMIQPEKEEERLESLY